MHASADMSEATAAAQCVMHRLRGLLRRYKPSACIRDGLHALLTMAIHFEESAHGGPPALAVSSPASPAIKHATLILNRQGSSPESAATGAETVLIKHPCLVPDCGCMSQTSLCKSSCSNHGYTVLEWLMHLCSA